MSSSPNRQFLSHQKLGRKASFAQHKQQSKADLESFLLEKQNEVNEAHEALDNNKQSPIRSLSIDDRCKLDHKFSIQNKSRATSQRLLQQISKQHRMREIHSRQQSDIDVGNINFDWRALIKYLKLVLFSYQFNLLDQMSKIDADLTQKIKDLLKIAPGHKPVQYVFTFYMLKYNFFIGLIAGIAYPLPYSVLFLMIPISFQLPFLSIFALAGMRSGVIALLLKYCFHFPKLRFHWIVFTFTAFMGLFLPNNYIFICLYLISIFLSFYLENKQQNRLQTKTQEKHDVSQSIIVPSSHHPYQQNQQKQIYKQYKVYDDIPFTYPLLAIGILVAAILIIWILNRYIENKYLQTMLEIMPISLLASSKEMLAFFPQIYANVIKETNFSEATFISASFLFPGPHIKAFMFVFDRTRFNLAMVAYLIIYLPSILLTCIFLAYRHHFYTTAYYNIRMSMQAVGNGIVLSLVATMLKQEECFFNTVCYASIVIMVVAKLYRLRQLFAITVGIFLISARTLILHVNKGVGLEKQACLQL